MAGIKQNRGSPETVKGPNWSYDHQRWAVVQKASFDDGEGIGVVSGGNDDRGRSEFDPKADGILR